MVVHASTLGYIVQGIIVASKVWKCLFVFKKHAHAECSYRSFIVLPFESGKAQYAAAVRGVEEEGAPAKQACFRYVGGVVHRQVRGRTKGELGETSNTEEFCLPSLCADGHVHAAALGAS